MSRVTRAVTIDIETGIVLARISEPYGGAWALCKESDAQKAAQAQQLAFNNQLSDMFKVQFADQQEIQKMLVPMLEAMAASPQGFGVDEYHALQAKIVNDVGAQFSATAKQNALEFATTNEAGLPSGVELSVDAATRAAAANAVVTNSTQVDLANEQLKQQQQQFAESSLAGIQAGIGSQVQSSGGLNLSGIGNQFQQATTVYNQGSAWKNILSGVVGAGLNFATGGLSGILQGGSFLSGAGQAVGGQPVQG